MATSFEEEIRAAMRHAAEQNPHLHAIRTGERSYRDLDIQTAFELQGDVSGMHSRLILKIAKEIDQLRAAIDGG